VHIVWINKNPWRKPGPIVYMGLLNALAFAWNEMPTTYFVGAGAQSDTDTDLREFYGVEPHPRLTIARISESRSQRRAVYTAACAHIEKLARDGESVLVCTRELGCLPALFALRKRYPENIRVLHECHDYYLTTRHLPKRDFAALRRQWSERLLLPKLDGLICLTEHQRALYQQHLPQLPAVALPLGTLPQPLPETLIEQRRQMRRVAYIGHLHDYKGLEELFALAIALKPHNIALHTYGGGAAQNESLRQRARKDGVEDTLQFTAFLPPRELHARLGSEISIGLVPLQDTYYNRYLTCPVKALDFIAHGLPVVGTDLPAVRAVVADAGLYATFEAVPTAALIAELLADPQRYAATSRASRIRAEQLTWLRRGAALLQFAQPLFKKPRFDKPPFEKPR